MEKLMQSKILDKTFLTGCDQKTEWQLPFFLDKFLEFKHKTKLIVCDFGMSEEMRNKVVMHKAVEAVMNMVLDGPETGWFLKPKSMLHCPSNATIWLDTDCEIRSNIDDLFTKLVPNKLNMVEDRPWTKRRGEVWYNSGVVGFIGKPPILHLWVESTEKNQTIGDQEVLHDMLNPITQLTFINPLPNSYNVLRLQTEHDNYDGKIKVMHWTGAKGNESIRSMMDE